MPLAARLYLVSVQVAGLLVFSYSVYAATQEADLRWLYLLFLTALASFLSVKVSSSGTPAGSLMVSAGDFFIFAAIVLAGPAAGALMGALEGLVSSWRVRVKSPNKLVFNATQLILAAYLAGTLYLYLLPGATVESWGRGALLRLFPVLVCALAYFLLNSLLVAVAMALASGQPLIQIIEKGFLWGLPSNFINASLVVIVLTLVGPIDVWLALALLPLIVLAYLLRRFQDRRTVSAPVTDFFDQSFFAEASAHQVQGFLLATLLLTLPLYAYSLYRSLTMPDLQWLYLAGLAAVVARFPLRLFSVRSRRWLTLNDLLLFVAIFQFGPEVGAVIAAIEPTVTGLHRSIGGLYDWVFRVGRPVLVVFFVGWLFQTVESTADLTNPSNLGMLNLVMALTAPMFCGFLYYLLLLSVTILMASMMSGKSFLALWRNQLGWAPPGVLGVLAGAIGYLLSGGFLLLR